MHKIIPLILSAAFFAVVEKLHIPETKWREKLTSEQYQSLREKKQDRAFINKYAADCCDGVYHCAGCDLKLFHSEDKISSITAYPSFKKPIDKENIFYLEDYRLGFKRYEIVCRRCEGHLGHIFKDEEDQGFIYCINSSSLIRKN